MVARQRVPFAPEFNFVVKRPFTFFGHDYSVGDEFDKAGVNVRLLERLYDQRKVDAVIPSIAIKSEGPADGEGEPEPTKAKGKGKKAKAKAEEPAERELEAEATEADPAPPKPAKNYRLESNFGKVRIMDGETLVRECETLEEATAAMQELSGE